MRTVITTSVLAAIIFGSPVDRAEAKEKTPVTYQWPNCCPGFLDVTRSMEDWGFFRWFALDNCIHDCLGIGFDPDEMRWRELQERAKATSPVRSSAQPPLLSEYVKDRFSLAPSFVEPRPVTYQWDTVCPGFVDVTQPLSEWEVGTPKAEMSGLIPDNYIFR
ncbi:MAG: hypothetical protein U0793_03565 [Gemmataceae bacterium]